MALFFKKGIVERGEDAVRALKIEKAHQGWRPFAYTILTDFEDFFSESDEPLLDRLYQSLRGGENVYKITKANRLTELDEYIAREIGVRFKSAPVVRIHDMAASNGITSFQLFSKLASIDRVRVHASDYYDKLYILRYQRNPWQIVFDADLSPLQIVGLGLVVSAYRPEPVRFLVNRMAQYLLWLFLLPKACREIHTAQLNDIRSETELSEASIAVVRLFHPKCLTLCEEDPRFTLGRDNLFQPITRKFELIRVMNALTQKHFDAGKVLKAIESISANLPERGLLILGRNLDECNGDLAATVFERNSGRLLPMRDFGAGYEMKGKAIHLQIRTEMSTGVIGEN